MEEAFEFDLRQSSLKVTHKKAKTDVKWENRTIQVDALEASHPVSVTVNDPKEINSLFDHAISYNKVWDAITFKMTQGFWYLKDLSYRVFFNW